MMFKELLTFHDTNAYLNLVSEKRSTAVWRQSYFLITSDLLERTIKLVDIRNEFFITTED